MSIGHPGFNVTSVPQSEPGGPAWEIAFLFPPQGRWSESDYLALDRGGGKLIELVDGRLEVLPMPTYFHQKLVEYLQSHLKSFVWPRKLGDATFAPFPVHVRRDHYREPDVVFTRPGEISEEGYPKRTGLVMEVVSEDDESRHRDLVEKPDVYASAGILEYWIVDPRDQTVTVLSLDGKQYRVHGQFKRGSQAESVLLPEFSIDVTDLFAAGKRGQ